MEAMDHQEADAEAARVAKEDLPLEVSKMEVAVVEEALQHQPLFQEVRAVQQMVEAGAIITTMEFQEAME